MIFSYRRFLHGKASEKRYVASNVTLMGATNDSEQTMLVRLSCCRY